MPQEESEKIIIIYILAEHFKFQGVVAHETHRAKCHNKVTPNKTKEFLKSPRFFWS